MLCKKIFTGVILVIALALAVFAVALPPEHVEKVILVSRFFEMMLPILATGALIKYLMACPSKGYCKECTHCETEKKVSSI